MSCPLKLIPISLLLLCNDSWAISSLEVPEKGIETIDLPDILEYSHIRVNKEGSLTVKSKGIEVKENSSGYGIFTQPGSKATLQPQNGLNILVLHDFA